MDDSVDDAQLTKLALMRVGFQDPLFHLTSGNDAIAYLAGEGSFADRTKFPLPEVIFLDLKMPGVDGFEILKWIKDQPGLARIIVIVLTSVEDVTLIKLAYQLGAHSYLSKEANDEELRNVAAFLRDYSRISSNLPHPQPESGQNSNRAA